VLAQQAPLLLPPTCYMALDSLMQIIHACFFRLSGPSTARMR
jgi:hypothetical protein